VPGAKHRTHLLQEPGGLKLILRHRALLASTMEGPDIYTIHACTISKLSSMDKRRKVRVRDEAWDYTAADVTLQRGSSWSEPWSHRAAHHSSKEFSVSTQGTARRERGLAGLAWGWTREG
jgi:hypothetical protein